MVRMMSGFVGSFVGIVDSNAKRTREESSGRIHEFCHLLDRIVIVAGYDHTTDFPAAQCERSFLVARVHKGADGITLGPTVNDPQTELLFLFSFERREPTERAKEIKLTTQEIVPVVLLRPIDKSIIVV
jgi:hypothetical protein